MRPVDPYAALRAELVAAAARAEVTASSRRWVWLRGRSRPLMAVLAAVLVSGSAVAGILTIGSSRPLTGRIPGARVVGAPGVPPTYAGYRYDIVVSPVLIAGMDGWVTSLRVRSPKSRFAAFGSQSVGVYPTRSEPLFGGGASAGGDVSPVRGDSVFFTIGGPTVAAIRVGRRTIRTASVAGVPVGDRAAVFFAPAAGPQPDASFWHTGAPTTQRIRIPNPAGRSRVVVNQAILPVGADGRVLPVARTSTMHSTARHWRAPGARGIDFFAAPGPVTSAPLSGVCTLRTAGLAGVAPQWGDTIARLVPLRDALGEVLMPCVDATYTYRGGQMLAAALVDARAPGAMPGPLPGAVPVPGAPGIVEIPDAGLDARRVGHEWLVVQNGGELTFTRGVGRASRLALLRALVLQVANGLGGR